LTIYHDARSFECQIYIVIYSYNKSPTGFTNSQIYFGKELYMFRTDLMSIIRSLNSVFTAIGICYTEILNRVKIIYIYICMYMYV